MTNLFQMLSNGVNNLKNNVQSSNFFNRLANQTPSGELPYFQPVQMREDGSMYEIPQPIEYKPNILQKAGNKLTDALLGQKAASTDSTGLGDGNTLEITASETPRTGGILRDITSGYQENRNNPISLNNFGQNQNKGIAYRIGEGLGSVGRFVDSPLGRGVLTGAAIGLLGGAPAEMLAYGGTATALNQGNRGRDTLYRQQLASEGIDTSNVRGYINDNTYKSMLEAKQMKDNAEYRNTYLAQQKAAQEEAREDRKLERELRRQENAANRALTMRGQDLNYASHMANLDLQRNKIAQAQAAKQNAEDFGDIQAQLDNFANTFEKVNNPYRYRVFGGASSALNTLSKDESNFNAQRTLLFNQIARKLGGEKGVLSDKDIARVEAALPSLSDTLEQKRAKMKAVYALLDIKQGSANQDVNNTTNDGWAF